MAIDLLEALANFQVVGDWENEVAYFRTQVAPEMYLNVVYKSAEQVALSDAARRLNFPGLFVEFLAKQNGAHLFAGALSIYGIHRRGQLLNRMTPFLLPPYNIADANCAWPSDPDRLLVIGGYRFDGSSVCMDRHDLHIDVFGRNQSHQPRSSWPSLSHWITGEVRRLSILFDSRGKRLVEESQTPPPPGLPPESSIIQ